MAGIKSAKKVAGDLVKRAPPNAKPASIALSSRNFLTVITENAKAHTPKKVNIESAKLMRSKNIASGEMAYIKDAANAVDFLEKRT